MNNELSLFNLTLQREKVYYGIILFISLLFWALLAIVLYKMLLLVLFFLLFTWLMNGLLIGHLKAESVKVDENQIPELANIFLHVCQQFKLTKIPALYIIQSGGLLNAFTTRHSGRNFVVIFSDILEAYGANSPEIRFLMGHEIGHIQRNHILKRLFLFPGMLVPLLGNAYYRICELTCDRYGAYAAEDYNGAVRAMMILAGGKDIGKIMSAELFASQYHKDRGFFVSWHELISTYPTLSQRVSNLIDIKEGRNTVWPRRNPLAYLLAIFPFGARGAGSAIISFYIIGLLIAIAMPNFIRARENAMRNLCLNNIRIMYLAKQRWMADKNKVHNDTPSESDLLPYLNNKFPKCPSGGNYCIDMCRLVPTCTYKGHKFNQWQIMKDAEVINLQLEGK